jgi:hypothetical protein
MRFSQYEYTEDMEDELKQSILMCEDSQGHEVLDIVEILDAVTHQLSSGLQFPGVNVHESILHSFDFCCCGRC